MSNQVAHTTAYEGNPESEHILWDELQQYAAQDLYPMHMPGHKRGWAPAPGLPAAWDMTEVPGVDDLHHAEGILLEAMQRTAGLFGAKRTWYLVNGSTVGILSSIRAICGFGGEAIIARNCHKAVYHAVEILHLTVHWIYPEWIAEYGIYGSVRPECVTKALHAYPQSKAVILTSPTYEGIVSDVRTIADLCHGQERPVPLIVDEAHGAHLGLFPEAGFPDSAVHLGADLIVQSAHKTLPSLTQTAFLHMGAGAVWQDERAIEQELDVFESSSPSYPLLASLDGCTGILRHRGAELFRGWRAALKHFDLRTQGLQCLRILRHGSDTLPDTTTEGCGIYAYDRGKILVSGNGYCTGAELADWLREHAQIETEMHLGSNVLAMTSCCDLAEEITRLAEALTSLDLELQRASTIPGKRREAAIPDLSDMEKTAEPPLKIAEAVAAEHSQVPMGDALDQISGEYVYCYPPGIPIMVPGERITRDEMNRIRYDMEQGCRIFHSAASQYAEADTDPERQLVTIVQTSRTDG